MERKKPHIKVYHKGTYFIFVLVSYRPDGTPRYTSFSQSYWRVINYFGPNNSLKYLKIPLMVAKNSPEYREWQKEIEALRNDQ